MSAQRYKRLGISEDEAIALVSAAVDFGMTHAVDGNWLAMIRKAYLHALLAGRPSAEPTRTELEAEPPYDDPLPILPAPHPVPHCDHSPRGGEGCCH